ncbi:MAG: aconitate hydratase [Clostridia bacterium]|nr:aconitate hydratase [Clostridia bacterium]
MNDSLTYKILRSHLLEGELIPGADIRIKVDQTLTQDTTGTMAYLQLEALNPEKKATELSVAYVDHNTLQLGFENADDHEYIRSVCEKYGLIYSKAGNGICHQLHLEYFIAPNKILIGSDSHTPTGGAMGAIAIGSGGLDIAIAISKGYYYMTVPKVMNIYLDNALTKNTSAKDIILYLLKILTVKGGVGYILEYTGPGVKSLTISERATITNMGAELGATTSIFVSDEMTRSYLEMQDRVDAYIPLSPDENPYYDAVLKVDLSQIEPLVACPHSPDNVTTVASIGHKKVDQIAIGSCTNGSFEDLMQVAQILKGKKIHDNVDLVISPGSSNVLRMLIENHGLKDLVDAGARILEPSCGPCIGMGQAPKSEGISLRTFNRNFKGRCGTLSAEVYLVSPETAAYSALTGELSSPQALIDIKRTQPQNYLKGQQFFKYYAGDSSLQTVKGPNIKAFPEALETKSKLEGKVLLKASDNMTTDDIIPSNANMLPLRSNIPKLSEFVFHHLDPEFYKKARNENGGFIVGGENYGQGSSREHAALVPLALKITCVVAKSFSRIHKKNLINAGIYPFQFEYEEDYHKIVEGENYEIQLEEGYKMIHLESKTSLSILLKCSQREKDILKAGGALKYEEAQ